MDAIMLAIVGGASGGQALLHTVNEIVSVPRGHGDD